MKPLEHGLTDGKFAYPGMLLQYDGDLFLFDCGEGSLSKAEVNALKGVFLSHLHIDHFFGFDRVISHSIGRADTLAVYGPEHSIGQVLSKVQAYTWNLVSVAMHLRLHELGESQCRRVDVTVPSQQTPHPDQSPSEQLLHTSDYHLEFTVLDHGTPSIAYAFIEHDVMNVDKEKLEACGLAPGPWLAELKSSALSGENLRPERAHLLTRRAGRRIVYATDFGFTDENIRRLVELARGADVLYCEANFLAADEQRARETRHLTAPQAGSLATLAGGNELRLFHHSRKHRDPQQFIDEAAEEFDGPIQ